MGKLQGKYDWLVNSGCGGTCAYLRDLVWVAGSAEVKGPTYTFIVYFILLRRSQAGEVVKAVTNSCPLGCLSTEALGAWD